jgi:hypothetical protein
MRSTNIGIVLALSVAGAVGATTEASAAGGRFIVHHPARTEILGRAANQSQRITEERAEGDLTARQAHRLHAADVAIAHREQVDARINGGHLSPDEVKRLNGAETRVGSHIAQ